MYKRLLSLILVVAMLVCSGIPTFAAEIDEEYISDLRLIYADDYDEAREALVDSDFESYKVFNYNLNDDTGEVGVWLAYKTTTEIEDAITDISIMQMDGGYREGNYQEMIKDSFEEYERMGENYILAIDYFINAYDEGDFLAQLAYRQLNFYTSITDESLGIEIPDFDGEPLGDVFYDGITATELATIFMEGNSYVLDNIRALLAMGVSYNEDGKHYLEKVTEAAELFEDDEDAFEDHDYYDNFDDLATVIYGSIETFKTMFKELEAIEDDIDYFDEEVTELEVKYIEQKSLADRLKEVDYLGGKTLYDFCLKYEHDKEDLTPLYPLVAALNEGQIAMTKVAHYSDVVRYSMTDYPEDELIAEVERLEAIYSAVPFNVYTGVDRSIYYGTFALTSAAYRANAYTGEGLLSHLFMENVTSTMMAIDAGFASLIFGAWAISRTKAAISASNASILSAKKLIADMSMYNSKVLIMAEDVIATTSTSTLGIGASYGQTCGEALNTIFAKVFPEWGIAGAQQFGVHAKITMLHESTYLKATLTSTDYQTLVKIGNEYADSMGSMKSGFQAQTAEAKNIIASGGISNYSMFGTGMLYAVSAALMLYTAYTLGHTVWNYYHPEYTDIPTSLVDLIDTVDGDRYIKYDVVLNAETNRDGVYEAADLNAFEGQRWNALYYTKSYEAGKPLLADTFVTSTSNNKPRDGYSPVHRFGEVVCYDLNKYTYGFTTSIYLSVKQSKNNKSAVADVPELVGSVIGTGYILIAGGIGAALGVGGTVATHQILKKKKTMPKAQPLDEDAAGQ